MQLVQSMRSALFSILIVPALFLLSLFLLPKNASTAHTPFELTLSGVSGNTATFNIINPSTGLGAGTNSTLAVIETGYVSPVIPGLATTVQYTAPGPGTYTAVLMLFTAEISHQVPFTVTAAGVTPPVVNPGAITCDPASIPANFIQAHNKVIKIKICNNNMDSIGFNWSQMYATTDSLYSLIWAQSLLDPAINVAMAKQGALASTGHMVAALYTPPASGVQYMAGLIKRLDPAQPAYAQTIGADSILSPVQTIWEQFRNVTYVGFVIVFVIVGFMIMFRSHISPQAVATIQDSLPRIVIALILVTFSYAIAGLMIDLMFLFLNIAIAAINPAGAATASNKIFGQSVFGVITHSWFDTFGVVKDAIGTLIDNVLDDINVGKLLSFFGGALAGLVIGIAMLFIMFKVFFNLLIAYATIIILTIAAPFFFLMGALPGNNSSTTWFKQMAANIAVFPTVAIMFILAGYLGNIGALGGTGDIITPGNVTKLPLLAGDIDPSTLGKLVGIGLLLMTPAAADLVKNAIGAKSQGGGAAGAAAAGALAGGAAVVGGVGGAPFRPSGARGKELEERQSGIGHGSTSGASGRVDSGRTGPGGGRPT